MFKNSIENSLNQEPYYKQLGILKGIKPKNF